MRLRLVVPLLLAALALAPACRREAQSPGARYPITGRVVEVDLGRRSVTLAHEEIPGFMPAMTMSFVVLEAEQALLQQAAPGDTLTATLVVMDSRYWLEGVVLTKPREPEAGAHHAVVVPMHEPQPGDVLPDVALVDQDGHALQLAGYRGRALALTFVYTRCPLPDFCPFLMRSFARVHERLVADPVLARRTALVTVSFDVEHDTPAVLRAFGLPFQKTEPPFTHWRLATGTLDAIRTLGQALGLEFGEEEGSFNHNLRTAVVGPDGRLRLLLRGNDWKPDQLLAELAAAAR